MVFGLSVLNRVCDFGEDSIRYDHNQDPAAFKVIEINYSEKTAKKKRQASWFSRYFGQSSRPSSGDLMKVRLFHIFYIYIF